MAALAAAAAPGIGLVIYALFIWRLTGDPLAFFERPYGVGQDLQGLGTLVAQQYSILANAGLSGYVGAPGYDALNAIGALFAVATVWPVARRLGLAYGLFMVINILPALANGGLLSAGRFSSVLFPAFIWLATAVPSQPPRRLDRDVRRHAGLRRRAVLYVATAVLTSVARRPLLSAMAFLSALTVIITWPRRCT